MTCFKLAKLSVAFFFLTVTSAVAAPAEQAPGWLQQAAAVSVPTYDKDTPAVVLRKEQAVTVASDGRITTVTTFAVRILTREGRAFAQAGELYLTQTGKVREMTAWLIRPNGFVKKYGKDQTVDRISNPNDIYDEYRVRVIDAIDDADEGVVFGYQSTSEERPLFNQDIWNFQNRLPTLVSRYTLTLPTGWMATGVVFNYKKLEPTVNGSVYTWELLGLDPIRPEPASPALRNLAPMVAINYFPAEVGSPKAFETWSQVSRWGAQMYDPLSAPDETVAAKARTLTANAKSELDKIRAIARFVQNLQYIAIDIGVGRGNGYKPRPPAQVLAKAYGDCKDKANLMRAMLKSIGINAYPVFIYLGDPTLVREEWPSPTQFNHCIIAINISEETKAPTVIQDAKLGRLLIFDATDPHTPVGDLPDEEQGSLALVVAGDSGSLLRMPTLPPDSSNLDRQTEIVLTSDGSITGNLKERSIGQTAVNERRAFRSLSNPDYKSMLENWVTRGATAAKVSKFLTNDDSESGKFDLDMEFSAPHYAQDMAGRLLVFKPAIVSRRESVFLTEPTRKHPVVLDSYAFTETVRVKLPGGFDVDELPDPVKIEVPFGSYKTSYEVKAGELLFTRSLAQKAGTIPADQYQSVRSFYQRVRAAEQAPVVLARK
ncbi:MAG TPA: transglutaminase domain-containing protein [Pyrinomonadaceae bacterium]|nr:transglutaminase domain-containing protein [Pyrinomonadaceae bacterium]